MPFADTALDLDDPLFELGYAQGVRKLQAEGDQDLVRGQYSSRPCPSGCSASERSEARCCPYSSNTSLPQSTNECSASLIIAELPVQNAAAVFVAATRIFPISAAITTCLDEVADDITARERVSAARPPPTWTAADPW